MKKRKLRKFVLPTLYLMILGVMAAGITFLSNNLLESNVNNDERYNYTMSVFNDNEENQSKEEKTNSEIKTTKPFTSDKVSTAKEFYIKGESKENQEKALIYYEGTYMPSTGILYECDEIFDVASILEGTVKDIKQDEILGNVMTIEHNNKLTSIYYTLGEIKVKVGDKVTQNQVISTSGNSKLESVKPNTLLFETYVNGQLTNPNTIIEKNISELN